MSDFETDIDDQLLELAGATENEKKRKRRNGHSSSKKKRKADYGITDSDEAPESEEKEEDADPYPLDGKYTDEADRQKLLEMSEIQREEILAQRAEEMQNLKDRRQLAQMVKNQGRPVDGDSVAQAAKRQHTVRGATKEKTRKLDELKAKRRAKDEKRRHSSPRRDRSSSPMDMEISDSDESEDGIITKEEQQEEKERKIFGSSNKEETEDQQASMADLQRLRVSREIIVKHALAPWFDEYMVGAWVRFLIGNENGQPVYRICQVTKIEMCKPYRINDKFVDQQLELKHGKAVKAWAMDKISNAPFTEREWDRLVKVCAMEEVKLPTKRMIDEKVLQMERLVAQPLTETDINTMLARKAQLQAAGNKTPHLSALERSRLNQARTLAIRRHDHAEVVQIDAQLAQYVSSSPSPNPSTDLLAKVNERNRKANLESVRAAELAETERKRRDRKLVAQGQKTVETDPSRRLKTVPRLFESPTPGSRPGTPASSNTVGPSPTAAAEAAATAAMGALPPSALSGKASGSKSVQASIIESLEIDLGDF
ncbi:hypothetical protein BDQ17DRAFT_1420408 [Cyathus striatus]|nr:hypothetical protein BDQ17DRAFT_1420408 [Cyathus striatus]